MSWCEKAICNDCRDVVGVNEITKKIGGSTKTILTALKEVMVSRKILPKHKTWANSYKEQLKCERCDEQYWRRMKCGDVVLTKIVRL